GTDAPPSSATHRSARTRSRTRAPSPLRPRDRGRRGRRRLAEDRWRGDVGEDTRSADSAAADTNRHGDRDAALNSAQPRAAFADESGQSSSLAARSPEAMRPTAHARLIQMPIPRLAKKNVSGMEMSRTNTRIVATD